MKLTINRCPEHGEFWSVSIDHESGGTRVTPSKCCGRWRVVKSWTLSAGDWQELSDLADKAAKFVAEAAAARVAGGVA